MQIQLDKLINRSMDEVILYIGVPDKIEIYQGYPYNGKKCIRCSFLDEKLGVIFKNGTADRMTIENELLDSKDVKSYFDLLNSTPDYKGDDVIRFSSKDGIHEIGFYESFSFIQVSIPK